MTVTVKDPGARVDYAIDWGTAYLNGQAIAASVWSVVPDQPRGVAVAAHSHDLLNTMVTLTGGAVGQIYAVTNRVTMTDGQIDERTLTIRVDEA